MADRLDNPIDKRRWFFRRSSGGGDGFGRGVLVARPRSRRVDERAEFGAQRMLGVLAAETGDLPIELGDVEEGDLVVCRCRCHVSALSEESGCKMAAAG